MARRLLFGSRRPHRYDGGFGSPELRNPEREVFLFRRRLGLAGRDELYQPSATEEADGAVGSEWVVLARRPGDLAFLDGEPRWTELTSDRRINAWTDDFSNIVSVLKW